MVLTHGFGQTGPNAQAPGHDLTYLGSSGLLDRLPDGPPTPPGAVLSLPLAASLATTGILAALTDARRTGRGTHVDASMTDSAMWVLSEDIARQANEPRPPWGTFSARNVYACADGRYVTVVSNEPRSRWRRRPGARRRRPARGPAGDRSGKPEGCPDQRRTRARPAVRPRRARQVVAWLEQRLSRLSWIHHVVSNFRVDLDGDVAQVRSMFHCTAQLPGVERPIVTGGHYHEVYVRTGSGWRIQRLLEDNRG